MHRTIWCSNDLDIVIFTSWLGRSKGSLDSLGNVLGDGLSTLFPVKLVRFSLTDVHDLWLGQGGFVIRILEKIRIRVFVGETRHVE